MDSDRDASAGVHRGLLLGLVALTSAACSADIGASGGIGADASVGDVDPDAETGQPEDLSPCEEGRCWDTELRSAVCGPSRVNEDFGTGNYNVHAYAIELEADLVHTLLVRRVSGPWSPRIILRTSDGVTIFDGEMGAIREGLRVVALSTSSEEVSLELESANALSLTIYVTGEDVAESNFAAFPPQEARYELSHVFPCESPALISPPNFDPTDLVNGYFLLPQSEPEGLYVRKADACSRGNRNLIDVIYTGAVHLSGIHPELAPIAVRDMNKGSCSTVNHSTHNDGTHADLVAGCGTSVSCADTQPAIDFAKILIDTGEICGILFNDTVVQGEVNAYFASKFSYEPWKGTFMRSVSGHVSHFHVRVKKPDGSCN